MITRREQSSGLFREALRRFVWKLQGGGSHQPPPPLSGRRWRNTVSGRGLSFSRLRSYAYQTYPIRLLCYRASAYRLLCKIKPGYCLYFVGSPSMFWYLCGHLYRFWGCDPTGFGADMGDSFRYWKKCLHKHMNVLAFCSKFRDNEFKMSKNITELRVLACKGSDKFGISTNQPCTYTYLSYTKYHRHNNNNVPTSCGIIYGHTFAV